MQIFLRPLSLRFYLFLLTGFFLLSLPGCAPDTEYNQSEQTAKPVLKTENKPPSPPVSPPEVKTVAVKQPDPLADPETAADPSLLRIGINGDFPPFLYSKDKALQGLEADLLTQFAAFINKKIVYIKVPSKRATEALVKEHVDMLVAGRKTFENSKDTCFTEPYLRSGQIFLVRESDKALFTNGIYSLEHTGYTFGVLQGSPGDIFLAKNIKGIKVLRYQTVTSAIAALNKKKIDIFLHDAPVICHYAAQKGPVPLTAILTLVTEEYLGWEIRKDDKELRQLAAAFISQNKANGHLQQTIKHWIPQL